MGERPYEIEALSSVGAFALTLTGGLVLDGTTSAALKACAGVSDVELDVRYVDSGISHYAIRVSPWARHGWPNRSLEAKIKEILDARYAS